MFLLDYLSTSLVTTDDNPDKILPFSMSILDTIPEEAADINDVHENTAMITTRTMARKSNSPLVSLPMPNRKRTNN